jgi:hypothetical protein
MRIPPMHGDLAKSASLYRPTLGQQITTLQTGGKPAFGIADSFRFRPPQWVKPRTAKVFDAALDATVDLAGESDQITATGASRTPDAAALRSRTAARRPES